MPCQSRAEEAVLDAIYLSVDVETGVCCFTFLCLGWSECGSGGAVSW